MSRKLDEEFQKMENVKNFVLRKMFAEKHPNNDWRNYLVDRHNMICNGFLTI